MKKLFIFLVVCFSIITSVYASDIQVQINGEIIDFTDSNGAKVTAQIINDRTMVPFRKIFNSLGVTDENITWIGETRTVIAKKDNLEIELQIDNNVAKKTISGETMTITLDSAPVIYENRTLVPVRFIAESMDKLVGWDASNRTAVIIDFEYFLNQINEKSSGLSEFISNKTDTVEVSITRNYFDLEDSAKNDTATITSKITEKKSGDSITDNITVTFSGSNELMQEISTEGWSTIQLENTYYEDYLITKALDDGLKKVYGQEQMKFKYSALNCGGKYNSSFSDAIRYMCGIDEKDINTTTFETLKNEFSGLMRLLKASDKNTLGTGEIISNDIAVKYFDFTKFDNIIYGDSINRTYNFLNSQLFKFDVVLEELFYNYLKINFTIKVNFSEINIDFVGMNEYNEKVQYEIKIKK